MTLKKAQLYELPLLLTLVQVLSLSVPQESAFQQADAEFFLVGDELQLHNIVLRGKTLMMIGSGVMSLSTQALNLKLITASPFEWKKIPVLTELLEGTARELVEVVVTGTPQKPKATARPLRSLSDAIDVLVVPKKLKDQP